MTLTLDEAIKHCEEVAEENQKVVDTGIVYDDVTIDMLYCDDTEVIEEHLANYQMCADEYRQLAEWLKELKALKKNDNVKEVFKDCDTCKYLNIEADDYPCDRCMHRYINQYVYDDKREVNTDGCSD